MNYSKYQKKNWFHIGDWEKAKSFDATTLLQMLLSNTSFFAVKTLHLFSFLSLLDRYLDVICWLKTFWTEYFFMP